MLSGFFCGKDLAMNLLNALNADTFVIDDKCHDKDSILNSLSQLLASDNISASTLLAAFKQREDSGSTAIGQGIAIPHIRLEGVTGLTTAFFCCKNPIPYGAYDEQPVDLFFALLVPIEANDEHLTVLAELAALFSEQNQADSLRHCTDSRSLFELTVQYLKALES